MLIIVYNVEGMAHDAPHHDTNASTPQLIGRAHFRLRTNSEFEVQASHRVLNSS